MKHIIIILLISLVLINGCVVTECDKLALKFDRFVEKGCHQIDYDKEIMLGATLIDIKEPIFVKGYETDPLNEYNYKLTFKGINKKEEFILVNKNNISIEEFPYKISQFYKFDFRKVCGSAFSMGPHGGGKIFVDYEFNILESFSCAKYQCKTDYDCIVAIDINVCCSCPRAYPKQQIEENKNLMVYEEGKDYSSLIKVGCKGVMCKICLSPENYNIKCENNQCKMIQKQE